MRPDAARMSLYHLLKTRKLSISIRPGSNAQALSLRAPGREFLL